MATQTSNGLRQRFRGLSVVALFLAVYGLAFAVAYLLGRPTGFCVFVVFTTLGIAYAYETRRRPRRAAVRFLLVQGVAGVGAVIAEPALQSLLSTVFGVGEVSVPLWFVFYVLFGTMGSAILVDHGGFTIVMATAGSLLVAALGLPLLLFVARQEVALVVEKALDPTVHRVLYLGIFAPLVAALLSLSFGVPLAYLLAEGFAGQQFVESMVDLPLVVPHSVAGIVILFGFGAGGVFPGLDVLGSLVGMILAMIFVSAPYAVNTTREAFEAIDDRLEYASRIHGASQWQTFRRVLAPLAVRGIITGGVLAWARSVSEFGAVAVVAYSVTFFYPFAGEAVTAQHAPVFVYNTYLQGGLAESGAVSFLLLAVSAVIFLIVRYLTDEDTVIGGMV
ncbi:ABC transporter permease [Halanaeroarchaeum sulfurireducens]|uniref:Sulfate ABC transporter permease n=1 Tax=Halanaeroarchaeum sulfurireducens TaxID=1604004 RepID=A0A0N9N4Z1_9EURY|nr:ABC transporter permease [Halanaeroarchaeum sulfurireducens]ALG81860.1 sulfate ABC transporter permease [Halanaeroarchaeum sulfurireducens]